MLKRNADWLEKMSVGCFLVGLFQGQATGLFLGFAFYAGSVYLTCKIGGRA
jgi:hypothetical protein